MEYLWLFAFVAVALAWKYRHAIADLLNKRDQALREFAATRGWSYQSSGAALAENWTGEPFGAGDNRRAKYVLRGRYEDRKIVASTTCTTSGSAARRRPSGTPSSRSSCPASCRSCR